MELIDREARDWSAVERHIAGAASGPDCDDLIDQLTEEVFDQPASRQCAAAMRWALERAQSVLTRRSAALALALAADGNDRAAVDALTAAFRSASTNSFLAASVLSALALLASRNALARAELNVILLQIDVRTVDASYNRYLLISAAKAIGLLLDRSIDGALHSQLDNLAQVDDSAVQAEARFQLALTSFAHALLSPDKTTLIDRLCDSRAAFFRADVSEEQRPDASMFVHLLDTLIAFRLNPSGGDVEQHVDSLQKYATRWAPRVGGYQSDLSTLRAIRVLGITDALRRAAHSAAGARSWIDFYQAVIGLAAVYSVIRDSERSLGGRNAEAFSAIGEAVVAPALGPLLSREVSRERLLRILDQWTATEGNVEVTRGLRALMDAASIHDVSVARVTDSSALNSLAVRLGRPVPHIVEGFFAALASGTIDQWTSQVGFPRVSLPIDRPGLYGGDPNVDETVRLLLRHLRERLGQYEPRKWMRIVSSLEAVVGHVNYIRNSLPEYTRCAEDGGKGQAASEHDLQESLFHALQMQFGRSAIYEGARVGGGRTDAGLNFPECQIPIEVKHEFKLIERQHIHANYLMQADIYAGATDRVAMLLILDLRSSNATSHRLKRTKRSQAGAPFDLDALYRLKDGFWIDELTPDSQIEHPEHKAVIVGLVPGNRPLPSSTTVYSRRPGDAPRRSRQAK